MRIGIDVGNTLINFCLMDKQRIIKTYKIETHPLTTEDIYRLSLIRFLNEQALEPSDISCAVISCVVAPLFAPFRHLCNSLFPNCTLYVGKGLKSGIQLKVDNPNEVGADLVAVSVGASLTYGGDLFIADLGTASKYILLSSSASFLGLAIAPGIRIKAEALANKASALPEITLIAPPSPIGKNTMDCMNSGAIYGSVYEIEGFAKVYEEKYGKRLKKILTGGNAPYVKDYLHDFIYDENLLFKGLNEIASRNNK